MFVAGLIIASLWMLGGCTVEEDASGSVTVAAQPALVRDSAREEAAKAEPGQVYSTWRGSLACADTCASAWLMKRFVDKEAEFRFYERDAMDMEGVLFSVPQAELRVSVGRTTFEAVIEKYGLDDPALAQITRIIRDIDINRWSNKVTEEARGLESLLRGATVVSEGDDREMLDKALLIFDCLYADIKSRL
jgi:hypothetical protein